MQAREHDEWEQGFTLIELLITIVVAGILATVAIVGLGGVTNTGDKSACRRSADAALASATAYFSNQTPNAWPATVQSMTTSTPPVFSAPAGALFAGTGSPSTMKVGNWTLTQTGGAATMPSYDCS